MIPTKQTIFGDKKGNCFAACIASMLEIPLGAVPNFCANYPAGIWWDELRKWLHRRKYEAICFKLDGEYSFDEFDIPAGFNWIASGKSPRGDFLHSVIFGGRTMIHDPHPDGDGLDSKPSDCIFLVPFVLKGKDND